MTERETGFAALAATYPQPAPDAPLIVLIEDDSSAVLSIQISGLDLGCPVEPIMDLAQVESTLLPLLEREASQRPVLMIVDQEMPFNAVMTGVDGWALIGTVMEWMLEQRIAPILMVALSADLTAERRDYALASGAYAALAKPLFTGDLAALLERASDGQTAASIVASHERQPAPTPEALMEHGHRRTVRSLGQMMLAGLQSAVAAFQRQPRTPQWCAKSVAVLAKRPTDPERIELISALGGQERARDLLDACIAALAEQERDDGSLQASTILRHRINGASVTELEHQLGFTRAYIYRREGDGWTFMAAWLNDHAAG